MGNTVCQPHQCNHQCILPTGTAGIACAVVIPDSLFCLLSLADSVCAISGKINPVLRNIISVKKSDLAHFS
jgi:hypothetical protein